MKKLLLVSCLFSSAMALAEMDVDACDSLDFAACHTKKEDSIQIFEKAKEATKVFKQEEVGNKAAVKTYTEAESVPMPQSATPAMTGSQKMANAEETAGKVFEIRQRYTLGKSAKTPYSAFYVIEALHQQMATLCPNGWDKLREFSLPVEGDFYLHYVFECR